MEDLKQALQVAANDAEMLQGVVKNSDMNPTTKDQVVERLGTIAKQARTAVHVAADPNAASNLAQKPNTEAGQAEVEEED